jgi:hypothetical protein
MSAHSSYSFSRRDFLKLSSLSIIGFALPSLSRFTELAPGLQGRVIESKIQVYDTPTFDGQKVKFYWKDNVLPIINATASSDQEAYNRIWYQIGENAYIYSGWIQPVRTVLNQPQGSIPPSGCLAEVTVPFTDAHWAPGKDKPFAYRYYYASTHWVVGLVPDQAGAFWYHILDDKWKFNFYVPAQHLRLVPANELSLLSPHVPASARRIEVRLRDQVMVAFENEKPVFMARIASGAVLREGDFSTPSGQFTTFHKRPSRHMAAGDLASNGYDLPGVPWVTYFTESGIAFHGSYWHNDFGLPRSHGCINLTPQAACWVYRWTLPTVPEDEQRIYETYGTRVDVV